MKKSFKLFVFAISLFLIGSFAVKASYSIDFSNADNRHEINREPVYLSTYYRITNYNGIVYCYQPYVAYAGSSSYTGTLNYNDCSPVSKNAEQLAYIFINGYGGANAYAIGDDKFDNYYVTQLAVWYFGDRTLFSGGIDSLNNFNVSNGKLTGNYNGTSNKITEMTAKLINDANDSVNATSKLELQTDNTKLNITSDRSYYISSAIKIGGSWVKNAVNISISGVSGAFVTSDVNATSGGTSFNVGDTVYVKVPTSSVTQKSSMTLSISGTSKKGSGTINVCKNSGSPDSQKLADLTSGTPASVSTNLTLTAEPSSFSINISKQDITGSKEVIGATLVIKSGNTELIKWVSDGTLKQVSLVPGTYTLVETIAPAGYKLNSSKVTFTVNADGTIVVDGQSVNKVVMKNVPFYVTISKLGLDKNKELVGAKLKITDKEGKLVKDLDGKSLEWTTTGNEEKFHLADGTYYLTEIEAPIGYVKSNKTIEFVVEKDGTIKVNNKEVTKVTIENDPLYIYISKKSINGKTELPGAKLKITDKEGKLVKDLDGKSLEWTSSTKEERFRLAPGSYTLTELEAPNGYELSDTVIEFTVTEDGRILFDKKEVEDNSIVFRNTPEPDQVPTGSTLIYILFLGVVTAGVVTFFVLRRNN